MAFQTATSAPGLRHWPKWRRSRVRAWARRDDAGSIPSVLRTIPSLSRPELARLAQHMIDRLDEIDGDPDLEHLREDDEETYDLEATDNV
jgi:hypothetical protein